jgi:hypothetical protein
VIAGLLTLFPPAASPSDQFTTTFDMAYSSERPGASTGLNTRVAWSDPGEVGGKPTAIHRIRFGFHHGTRFDTSALPRCEASDGRLRRMGPSACPARTRLGSGSTEAMLVPGPTLTTTVSLFNARHQIIIVVTYLGVVLTEFRDEVKPHAIVVNPLLPPGVSLTKLSIEIDPHARGGVAYMRAPSRCPSSRSWTTVGAFAYENGTQQTLTSTTPCRRG